MKKFDEPRNSAKSKHSYTRPLSANSSGMIESIDHDDFSLRNMQHEGKLK